MTADLIGLRPRNAAGRYIKRECPDCGCGTLQYEGNGIWRCDGLADPGDILRELEACPFCHFDDAESPAKKGVTNGAGHQSMANEDWPLCRLNSV